MTAQGGEAAAADGGPVSGAKDAAASGEAAIAAPAGRAGGVGLTVTHRRYVPYTHAHYGGHLVDGAYVLGMFGDVATEVCIRLGGDEGLFASYDDVRFLAPVRAGDVLEATAVVTRAGRRSRTLAFEARVVCRARPDRGASAAEVLPEPLVVVTAVGTVVLPHVGR